MRYRRSGGRATRTDDPLAVLKRLSIISHSMPPRSPKLDHLCSDRVSHPRNRVRTDKPLMGKVLSSPAPPGRWVTLREHTRVISRECRSGTDDLWPDVLAPADVTPPVAFLQAQASLLSKKTKYKLRGKVTTSSYGATIRHSRVIIAPKGVSTLRPIEDEQQFVEWLREALASADTKRVIGSLLVQV